MSKTHPRQLFVLCAAMAMAVSLPKTSTAQGPAFYGRP